MFDVGFSELLLIALVALVVLGPERLPKAARFAGLWVRRARAQWYAVKGELERELAAEDLKRSLQETQAAMREAQAALRDAGDSARSQLAATRGQLMQGQAPAEPLSAAASEAGTGEADAQDDADPR
jgi:sec-independent protein translocase protein TatB